MNLKTAFAALLLLAACGAAPTAPHEAAAQASDSAQAPAEALLEAMGMPMDAQGQIVNDCGEKVTPSVHRAPLGGEVGTAWLVVIGGGPNMLTCYGMTGMAITLLRAQGDAYTPIFQGAGHLAIMPTAHEGVKDIAIGGPGFEFPVLRWDGRTYVNDRTISDGEFPQSLN